MADQGGLRHRLFFDQTEAQRAGKFFGGDQAPFLSKGLDPALLLARQNTAWLIEISNDTVH